MSAVYVRILAAIDSYRTNDAIKLIYADDCGRITPLMSRIAHAGILAELDKAADRRYR